MSLESTDYNKGVRRGWQEAHAHFTRLLETELAEVEAAEKALADLPNNAITKEQKRALASDTVRLIRLLNKMNSDDGQGGERARLGTRGGPRP